MSNEIVLAVVEALEAAQVPYLLAGSYAANVYGIPRATKDADFVVQLRADAIDDVMKRLDDDFYVEPQGAFETITGTFRNIIRVKRSAFQVELFHLSNDPHDVARFARKRLGPLLGHNVMYPSPEDVLITKLRWAQHARRGKDLDDIRNILAVQADTMDFDYVHTWCQRHGTRSLLDEIRRSLPRQ